MEKVVVPKIVMHLWQVLVLLFLLELLCNVCLMYGFSCIRGGVCGRGITLKEKLPFKEKALSGYSSLVAFVDPETVCSVFLAVSGCTRFI